MNILCSYAKLKGFHTYVIDLNIYEATTCFDRNVHNRSFVDIKKVIF